MEYSDTPPATYLPCDPKGDVKEDKAKLLEYYEIAGTRLALAFSDALTSAANQLFVNGTQDMVPIHQKMWMEAADFAKTRQLGTVEYFEKHHRHITFDARKVASQEQQKWLEAADFTRIRHQAMVDGFRNHLERRYLLACQRKPAAIADHALQFIPRQLKLVEVDTQVDTLDPTMLIEAIRNATWTFLHDQTIWFRSVMATPEMLPVDTPLGPRLIGNAIADAIHDQCWGHESKKRLLSALRWELPDIVKQVYLDMNGYLAREEAASQDLDSLPQNGLPAAPATPARHPDRVAEGQAETSVARPEDANLAKAHSASLVSATEAVAGRLTGIRLPRSVNEFLQGPWRDLLAKIQREQGLSSQGWEEALRTMDDLIGSLRVKAAPESRVALMRALPELARRLVRGLEYLGEDIGNYDPFFARLADYHIKVLGSLRHGSTPDRAGDNQDHRSPQTAQTRHENPPTEDGNEPEKPVATELRLDSLDVGAWLEVRGESDAARCLRLAWISPHRNLFILSNQQGERALSLTAKDLALRLREGRARIVPAPSLPHLEVNIAQKTHDKKIA